MTDLVEHLHHNAAETAHYLHNMHVCLALLKPKVSDADYMKLLSSVTLPLTTVEVVQYVDKLAGTGVDADRIRCHMPRARKFQGKPKATSLFACLVHYIMRSIFVNVQKHQLGYENCANLFGVSISALRRVFTGHKRKGGKEYQKEKVRAEEKDLECSCIECDPVETNIVEVQSVDTVQTSPPQEINSIWSQAFSVCRNIFQIPEEYRDLIY